MFYEGDLQSGIAKAMQESKLVACFVTDNGQESMLWENHFLQENDLKASFSDQTILLRLIAGSQEAGFLAAIYPLPKTPTLVIIKNGELKEYIASGVDREEFLGRLRVVFPFSGAQGAGSTASIQSQTSLSVAESSARSTQPDSNAVRDMLAERASRLEVDKKAKEAAEKIKRAAEAKARKAAVEGATAGTQKSADKRYALMQKKRQQEAKSERDRILKRVENDKTDRREREAQRKAQAEARKDVKDGRTVLTDSSSLAQPSITYCALQIRLFDGSTIRSRFPSDGTLRSDVRPWIDEQQAGDTPYTFKHVLTPLPNKDISISDEEQSLDTQGLAPNATLILVPVQDYTSAYDNGISAGFISRVASSGYGLVSSGFRLLGLGGGGAASSSDSPAHAETLSLKPAVNVRTLRDEDRDDQQFYNGNALNFEPSKDDDIKDG